MKTIPFDIGKAKAGAKVVTRHGLPVRILSYELNLGGKTIVGVVENGLFSWTNEGKFITHPSIPYSHNYDLMIQEEPKYIPFTKAVPLLTIVKEKNSDCNFVIVGSSNKSCFVAARGWVNYGDLFAHYNFEDGSPCGTLAD